MAQLKQTHERTARWDHANNCWDIADRILYQWTTIRHQPLSGYYAELTDALKFIINYDSNQPTIYKGSIMTTQIQAKFTDGNGGVFTVNEVIQTPVGLTVYYKNTNNNQEYSCLLDAFSERFREVQSND